MNPDLMAIHPLQTFWPAGRPEPGLGMQAASKCPTLAPGTTGGTTGLRRSVGPGLGGSELPQLCPLCLGPGGEYPELWDRGRKLGFFPGGNHQASPEESEQGSSQSTGLSRSLGVIPVIWSRGLQLPGAHVVNLRGLRDTRGDSEF